MRALIIKDLATMKKSLVLVTVLAVAIGYVGISQESLLMVAGLSVMIPIILSSISFGYDARSNFQQLAFSMPISRREYVLSKFFFAFVFGLAGAIAIFCARIAGGEGSVATALILSLAVLFITLLVLAVQLPFILRYGAEKGRLILVVTYFVVFGAVRVLRDFPGLLPNRLFGGVSLVTAGVVFLLASALATYALYRVSVKVMEEKEI